MTAALAWLALAVAVCVVPMGDAVHERVQVLAGRGRLRPTRSHGAGRRWSLHNVALVPAPVVGALVLVVVTVRAGPALGCAAGLAATTAGHLVLGAVRERSARRARERLLAAVRLTAVELESGAQPAGALEAAAEVDPSRAALFRSAADAARAGLPVESVLLDSPDLRPLAHAWRVAHSSGAPVAAVLARVAADLADRTEQERAIATALAGPRSSAAVLAVLPALGIVLGIAMSADPLAFLLGSPAGQVVCLLGVVLDVAGIGWTRRLAARAEPRW